MELKRVITSEIHWSIGWNASQQANSRLKEKIGDTSNYFAPLKVGNATYNWVVDSVAQWRPMGVASDSEKVLIMQKAEQVKQEVYAKLGSDESLASKICQVPNYEEYIFYKAGDNGEIDIIITGWGFHNFKKAGPFKDTWPPLPKLYSTTIAFVDEGERQPGRIFSIVTSSMEKPDVTDAQGLRVYKEHPGVTLTVVDDITQRRFTFTTADHDTLLEFDVTEQAGEPVKPETPAEPVKPVVINLKVLDSQGLPLRNATAKLTQGSTTANATLDGLGGTTFERDAFDASKPIGVALTTADGQQLDTAELQLTDNETEYVLQQNGQQGGSRLLEIIAFLLLLAAIVALLIFAFQPGIEEATKWINKNIF